MDNLNNEEMIEIDLREYIEIIWRKKWLIVAITFAAVFIAYIASSRMTPIYQTSTTVMVEEEGGMEELFGGGMAGLSQNRNKTATYIEILRSRRILDSVIKELDLRNEAGELIRAGSLRGKLNISRVGDTGLLEISIEHYKPELAKEIANKSVEIFQEENQELNQASLASASDFISEQLTTTSSNLEQLEERLLTYKEEHNVSFPSEQGKATLERVIDLESQLAGIEVNLKEAERGLEEIKGHLASEDEWIITSKSIRTNPLLADYRKRLANLEIDLAGLEEKYTERHPEVKETTRQIGELERRIADTVEDVIAGKNESRNPTYNRFREEIIDSQIRIVTNEVRSDALKAQLSDLEAELRQLPKQELELARLQREAGVAENVYTMLMERREELEIQRAMQTSDMLVIDDALVPQNPISPRKSLNMAIAMILGLFIALGIIFLIEFLDTTVKEEKDVERLTGLPVLGVIPDLDQIDHDSGYGRGEDKYGE